MTRHSVQRWHRLLLWGWCATSLFFAWRLWNVSAGPHPDLLIDRDLVIRKNPLWGPEYHSQALEGRIIVAVGSTAVHSARDLRSRIRTKPLELRVASSGADGAASQQSIHWAFGGRFGLDLDDELRVVSDDPFAKGLGLRPGDQLLEFYDDGGREGATMASVERRRVGIWPFRMVFQRPSTGQTVEAVFEYLDFRLQSAILIAGVALGAIGLAAFRLRPETRSAWGFLLFCLFWSLLWMTRSIPFWDKSVVERHLLVALRALGPWSVAFLLFRFSPLRRLPSRRLWMGLALVSGLALGLWNVLAYPEWAALGVLAPTASHGVLLLMLVLVVVGASSGAIARIAGARVPALDRQRERALRWGAVAGFAPITLHLLTEAGPRFPFELAVLLFPIALAYATVRHNIFRLNELLLEGLVYGALLLGIALVSASLIGGVVPLATLAFGEEQRTWITFALVLGTALTALPIHARIRERLNRRFERSDLDQQTLATDLELPTQLMTTPRGFSQAVVEYISEAFSTQNAALLIRHPPTDNWWLASATTWRSPGPSAEDCRPLLDALVGGREEIARDVLEEDLAATDTETAVVGAMIDLDAAYAFPLIVTGEVWGALIVGDKSTMTNYSFGELRALRRLAKECALGLYQCHVRSAYSRGFDAALGVAELFPRIPEKIGPYLVEKVIGEGAMSVVYLAELEGRKVAVKVLSVKTRSDRVLVERFRRESEILLQLEHPNVVPIEAAEVEPVPYLAMPFFERGSLRDVLRDRRRLLEEEARSIVCQVARGLEAALKAGVVHRDVKPRNILVANDGSPLISDFGIAQMEEATILTTHAQMLGTPGYLSPEACAGDGIDWRADQYALGITLFELLTGRRPFRARKVMEIFALHLHGAIPSLRALRAELSADVEEAVTRMLAKRPEDRFPSYDHLVEALS